MQASPELVRSGVWPLSRPHCTFGSVYKICTNSQALAAALETFPCETVVVPAATRGCLGDGTSAFPGS